MTRFRLNRRTLLRGAGGVALGLPLLEVMLPSTARAQALPSRYVVLFAGTSLGRGGSTLFPPSTVGTGYATTVPLAPLNGPYGDLRPHVGVVSNLLLPWGSEPGARAVPWHSSSPGPLLSGVRGTAGNRSAAARGPTSDQLVAAANAGQTRVRSLQYRVQSEAYRGGEGPKGVMSYAREANGNIVSITPISSIRLAYTNLVTGGAPSTGGGVDPQAQAVVQAQLKQRKSVLDLVLARSKRLQSRVSTADRAQLDRYFTELRELETSIGSVPEPTPGGAANQCSPVYAELQAKGTPTDPPVVRSTYGADARSIGYADETLRGKWLADLTRLAFTCDLTRSVSILQTYAQCFMAVTKIHSTLASYNGDLHETGHGPTSLTQMSHAVGWHVDHFAYLVRGLLNTQEAGAPLLDRCAVVLVFEGGVGRDPEGGANGSPHSSENMGALYAGRAGGLKPGQHIRSNQAHPARVLLSAMRAVGVNGPLGEITEPLAEMFA